MNQEIIYEISRFPALEMLFSSTILFFSIFIIGLIMCLKTTIAEVKSRGNLYSTGGILAIIICLILIIVFSYFLYSMLIDGIENEALKASEKYYSGEYCVIEGYAQEVVEGVNSGLFVFTIEEEEFEFSRWFGIYKKQLCGEYLKVYYIDNLYDNGNRIVKIVKFSE